MSRFRLCQHILDDGRKCDSPAMRRRSCCYRHAEVRRRRKRVAMAQLIEECARQAAAEQAKNERIFLRVRNLIDKSPEFSNLRDILCSSRAE